MHRILAMARAAQEAQAAAAQQAAQAQQQQQQEAAARAAEERARQEAARRAAEAEQLRAEQERAAREQHEREAQARREAEAQAQREAADRQAQEQRQQQQAEETRRARQEAAARAAEERIRQAAQPAPVINVEAQEHNINVVQPQNEYEYRPFGIEDLVDDDDGIELLERRLEDLRARDAQAQQVVVNPVPIPAPVVPPQEAPIAPPVIPVVVDEAVVQQRAQEYANDLQLTMEEAIPMARTDLENEARTAARARDIADNDNLTPQGREINALADTFNNLGRADDRKEMAKQIVEAQIARNNRLPWCLSAKQKQLQEAAQNVIREFGIGSRDAYIYAMEHLVQNKNYVHTTLESLAHDFFRNTPYHISRGAWYGSIRKFYDLPGEADKSEALLGNYASARLIQIKNSTGKPCLNLTNLIQDPQIDTWFKQLPNDLRVQSWQELRDSFQQLAIAIGNNDKVMLEGIGQEKLAVLRWIDLLESLNDVHPDLPARISFVYDQLLQLYRNNVGNNRALLHSCFNVIRNYADTCRDASMTGLEVIEIDLAAHSSKNKEEALFSVAISKYKRNIIQNIANDLTPAKNVEGLSLELFLKIFYNKVFKLGFRSEAMHFGGCTDEIRPTLDVLMEGFMGRLNLDCLVEYLLLDDITKDYIEEKVTQSEAYQLIMVEAEELDEAVYINKMNACTRNEVIKILTRLGYVHSDAYYPIIIN